MNAPALQQPLLENALWTGVTTRTLSGKAPGMLIRMRLPVIATIVLAAILSLGIAVPAQAADKVASITTMTVSPLTAPAGTDITITITVSGSNPSGWAGYVVNGTPTSVRLTNGMASQTIQNPSAGSYWIIAEYPGDDANFGSVSEHAIALRTHQSTTGLSGVPPTVVAGESVTLTSHVSSVNSTGSVTFFNGDVELGTAAVSKDGVARLDTQLFRDGNGVITAQYSGDPVNLPSTGTMTTTITEAPSATILTTNISSAPIGSSIDLTATVVSARPGGIVEFRANKLTLGTGTLDRWGIATLNVPSTAVGTPNFDAVYLGDTNNLGSTSPSVPVTITQAPSHTVLAAPTSTSIGSLVTMTATVTGYNVGGVVSFFNNNSFLGLALIIGDGVANFTVPLPLGSHSLTAIYSGDINNFSSASTAVTTTVTTKASDTVLTAPASAIVGGTVTLSARVIADGATAGTVSFFDNGSLLTTVTLGSSGAATFTTSALPAGVHTFTAVYSGAPNSETSTSTPVTTTVTKAPSSTTLAADQPSTVFGAPATFTATVTGYKISGSVEFYANGIELGTALVDGSGVATLTATTLPAGHYSVTAFYPEDTNNFSSTSAAHAISVTKVASNTTLTASATSATVGTNVALTASVTGAHPGGTVEFFYDANSLGTATLDSSGVATFKTSSLSVGTRTLTAIYSGDLNNQVSTSSPVFTTIVKATSSTTLTADTPSAVYGSPVTFTATVTGHDIGGNVIIYANGIALGTALLDSSGVATLTTSALASGSYFATAIYAEDANNVASVSAAQLVTVSALASSTTLSATPASAVVGSSVELTATVTGANPSGTIEFFDGATSLGTAALNSSGVASFSAPGLAVGTRSLTANYSGDQNNSGSTSAPIVTTIVKATSATTIAVASPSTTFGAPVTFTASVTGHNVGGNVEIYANGISLGTALLNSFGVATLTTSVLPVASYSVTAVYSDDANNEGSTSTPATTTVTKVGSTTTLAATPASPTVGATVELTATVTGANPSGTIEFFDGTTSLGTATLNSSGVASFSATGLAVGTRSLTAVYSGDHNNEASTSTPATTTVTKVGSTTTLAATPASPTVGATVELTATVTGANPSGTIEFFDGTTSLGTATLNSSGVASFSATGLAVGTRSLTAVYSGDQNNEASTSTPATVEVQPFVPAPTSVALDAKTTTTPLGTVATLTATVTVSAPVGPLSRGLALATSLLAAPSGLVEFFDNGTLLGTAALNAAGVATFTTPVLADGTHSFAAQYAGDTSSASSASPSVSVTVSSPPVIEPTPTPTPTPTPAPAATTPAAALPTTGTDALPLGIAALLLLALGATTILVRRRTAHSAR